MRALSYYGPGHATWEPVADPEITHDLDAVIRVDTVTICGTDLHILKGDVPGVASGRILGHEAVGTVVETGRGVGTIHIGDRVLVSCITACGRCRFCREGRYGQCLAAWPHYPAPRPSTSACRSRRTPPTRCPAV